MRLKLELAEQKGQYDDETFKRVKTLTQAPKYDGHTPQLTVERLLEWGSYE